MQFREGSYTYDRCLHCHYLGHGCGGPNTLCMDLDRWCEWLRGLKRLRGLTVQDIAEGTGISETTTQRILSGHAPKDIMRSTASILTKFIIGDTGQWPCAMAAEGEEPDSASKLRQQEEVISELRQTIKQMQDAHKAEIDTMLRLEEEKIAFLRSELEYLKEDNLKKDTLLEGLLKALK